MQSNQRKLTTLAVTLLDWVIGLHLSTVNPLIGFFIMALWAMMKVWLKDIAITDFKPYLSSSMTYDK